MLRLQYATPTTWADAVLADFDGFLQDHAANERKAAASALVLASHHPKRVELVDAMVVVAEEELEHFRAVWQLLKQRDQTLGPDLPDPYMSRLFKQLRRHDHVDYLMDRLLAFGIVEARGCERFTLLSEALPPGALKDFYAALVTSEARHHALFVRLAKLYFEPERVEARLTELLEVEARVAAELPHKALLH